MHETSAADRPESDLDVWVRYVLGVRRFTDSHLEAVDQYLTASWGDPMAPVLASTFLDRFAVFDRRRGKIRFARRIGPHSSPARPATWRLTRAGKAKIGAAVIPDEIDRLAAIPGGWESLLVLWATQTHDADERRRRAGALRAFTIQPVPDHIGRRSPLTYAEIVQTVETFNPAHSRLAHRDHTALSRSVAAQLRWLGHYGLAERRDPVRQPDTAAFGYLGTWGWQWMRRAANAHSNHLPSGPLLTQITELATGYGHIWAPSNVSQANKAKVVAYQRTQQLLSRLLTAHPRRWRGCAQEHPSARGPSITDHQPVPDTTAPSVTSTGRDEGMRRADAVLWQAGDPWEHPSVLVELEAGESTNRHVGDHFANALHIAAMSQRPTTVVFVATRDAHHIVRSALQRELSDLDALGRLQPHLAGAQLHVRLTSWKAAIKADPLTSQAAIDTHIRIPGIARSRQP